VPPGVESLAHLLTVRGGRTPMPPRAEVLGNRTIRGQEPLGVPGGLEPLHASLPLTRGLMRILRANGAAHRIHLERLPAYAPELNPGEGLWQQLKGVELRHVCCFDIPHLWHA
jgi:hypothetical protein